MDRWIDREADSSILLSLHQWICSAIHDSQQRTSPIGFLSLKLPPPPCAVLNISWKSVACDSRFMLFSLEMDSKLPTPGTSITTWSWKHCLGSTVVYFLKVVLSGAILQPLLLQQNKYCGPDMARRRLKLMLLCHCESNRAFLAGCFCQQELFLPLAHGRTRQAGQCSDKKHEPLQSKRKHHAACATEIGEAAHGQITRVDACSKTSLASRLHPGAWPMKEEANQPIKLAMY